MWKVIPGCSSVVTPRYGLRECRLRPSPAQGDTDGVTGAFFEVFGEPGAINHLLAGQVRRFAGGAWTNGIKRGLQGFLTHFFHFDGDSGRPPSQAERIIAAW